MTEVPMDSTQRTGAIYILLSVTGYAFFPIFARLLQNSGLPSLDIATWRFALAAPVFWLVVLARRSPPSGKRLPHYWLLGMGTLLSIGAVCAFFGLERIPVSTFIVLFYTYPAMVALISAFLGEHLPSASWLALGLTLVGVALTAPDFNAGLSGDNMVGVVLALVNAFIVAVMFMLSSRLLRGHTELARASAWSVTGACLVFLALALVRSLGRPAQPTEWLGLLAMACFSTVFPIFFLNAGIQKLGPTKASIMGTVEPVFTTLLAVLLLGEKLQAVQLLGGALILASLVMLQTHRSPQPQPVPSSLAGD